MASTRRDAHELGERARRRGKRVLSFTPEHIDDLTLSGCLDDVWVLYRLNYQSCLIIGVFESRDAAFAYTEKNGPGDESVWAGPHPGQRHWQYESEMFTYYIERHQIRVGPDNVQDAMLNFRAAGLR